MILSFTKYAMSHLLRQSSSPPPILLTDPQRKALLLMHVLRFNQNLLGSDINLDTTRGGRGTDYRLIPLRTP
jgi:hypothetical protein